MRTCRVIWRFSPVRLLHFPAFRFLSYLVGEAPRTIPLSSTGISNETTKIR
uniref:Uncharacterized protein n=1 Tax=Anguilla anguilla TaxID=7936 RepID=A0A0E9W8M0_ANGAN